MEYKWIGSADQDPKYTFTCQAGHMTNVFLHANPCTCGKYKPILDNLEIGFQATQSFRSLVCANRGSEICNNLDWDDIDKVSSGISRLQDKILVNLSNMKRRLVNQPIIPLKKRKISEVSKDINE